MALMALMKIPQPHNSLCSGVKRGVVVYIHTKVIIRDKV
jgi:hypothetical protein